MLHHPAARCQDCDGVMQRMLPRKLSWQRRGSAEKRRGRQPKRPGAKPCATTWNTASSRLGGPFAFPGCLSPLPFLLCPSPPFVLLGLALPVPFRPLPLLVHWPGTPLDRDNTLPRKLDAGRAFLPAQGTAKPSAHLKYKTVNDAYLNLTTQSRLL